MCLWLWLFRRFFDASSDFGEDVGSRADKLLFVRPSVLSLERQYTNLLTFTTLTQWQCLIVELGILPAPDVPFSNVSETSSDSGASDWTATEDDPFPTSLTAAKRILKQRAHINLVDYLKLRKKMDGASIERREKLKGLVMESQSALRRCVLHYRL